MDEFKGKVFLITGGSSGIGRASSLMLSKEGAKVIATGRDDSHMMEVLEIDPTIDFIKSDLRDENSYKVIVNRVFEKTDVLNGFVHCAGITYPEPCETFRLREMKEMLTVNVLSGFEILKGVLSLMKKGGSVVFISSIDAFYKSTPPSSGYALAKGSLISLTNALAPELGEREIRVNAVIPGLIRTRMTEDFFAEEFSAKNEELLKRIPLKREGKPEEVASLIKFLLSEESSYITGTSIFCDGGYHTG